MTDLSQVITQVLPLLLYGERLSWQAWAYFVALMVSANYLPAWIKYLRRPRRGVYVDYHSIPPNGHAPNDCYRAISQYLAQYHMETRSQPLECSDEVQSNIMSTSHQWRYQPVYSFPDESEFPFDFQGQSFRVRLYEICRESKTGNLTDRVIRVHGQSVDQIKRFQEHTLAEFYDQLDKKPKQTGRVLEYSVGDEQWVGSVLPVNKTFENLFLSLDNHRRLTQALQTYGQSRDMYHRNGIPYKLGLLFSGEPGCGKSSTIYAIARELNRNIYRLRLQNFGSNADFITAVQGIQAGDIVVLEDVDANSITWHRSAQEAEQLRQKACGGVTFDTLLEVLDGYTYLHDTIIIFTTNHPEKLDRALIRPGRIDQQFVFGPADRQQVSAIFRRFFSAELTDEELRQVFPHSTSHIINTAVLPHVNEPYQKAWELLCTPVAPVAPVSRSPPGTPGSVAQSSEELEELEELEDS